MEEDSPIETVVKAVFHKGQQVIDDANTLDSYIVAYVIFKKAWSWILAGYRWCKRHAVGS